MGIVPLILPTWEAEIKRLTVWGQPRQIVCETPSPKTNQSKKDWRCGSSGSLPALQVWSPEFQSQPCHIKKEKEIQSIFDLKKKHP
jgi:hypothetical protein